MQLEFGFFDLREKYSWRLAFERREGKGGPVRPDSTSYYWTTSSYDYNGVLRLCRTRDDYEYTANNRPTGERREWEEC